MTCTKECKAAWSMWYELYRDEDSSEYNRALDVEWKKWRKEHRKCVVK